MELTKTIICPGDDDNEILQKRILKMVVVGDRRSLVETADYLAEEPPTQVDRYVIWYKHPDMHELKSTYPELEDLIDFKAFSLSTTNKVGDVIAIDDAEDNLRVEEAYTEAGRPKYNK